MCWARVPPSDINDCPLAHACRDVHSYPRVGTPETRTWATAGLGPTHTVGAHGGLGRRVELTSVTVGTNTTRLRRPPPVPAVVVYVAHPRICGLGTRRQRVELTSATAGLGPAHTAGASDSTV